MQLPLEHTQVIFRIIESQKSDFPRHIFNHEYPEGLEVIVYDCSHQPYDQQYHAAPGDGIKSEIGMLHLLDEEQEETGQYAEHDYKQYFKQKESAESGG